MTSCIKSYKYLPSEYLTLTEIQRILSPRANTIVLEIDVLSKDVDIELNEEPQIEEIVFEPYFEEPDQMVEPLIFIVPLEEPIQIVEPDPVETQTQELIELPQSQPPPIIEMSTTVQITPNQQFMFVKIVPQPLQTGVVQLKKFERFRVQKPTRQ